MRVIREYCPYQLMDNRFCNELQEKHPTTALFELTKADAANLCWEGKEWCEGNGGKCALQFHIS